MTRGTFVDLKMLILALAALSACQSSGPSGPSHPDTQKTKIFVNGDPRELIADTDQNRKSFLTPENYSELTGIMLTGAFEFRNKEEFATIEAKEQQEAKDNKELVRERSAPEINVLQKLERFRWMETSDGVALVPSGYSSEDYPYYFFRYRYYFTTQKDGTLKLTAIADEDWEESKENRFPVEVLHYSLHESKKSFSLLFSYEFKEKKRMISVTFSLNPLFKDYDTRSALSPFKLLFGPGADAHWAPKLPVTFTSCGITNAQAREGIRASVEVWRKPLEGRLEVGLSEKARCPPFSDLNVQNIQITSKYKLMRTSAFATPVMGAPETGLVDGDIQILANLSPENLKRAKITDAELIKSIKLISVHEMGHVLGLNHQADKDSVMNYNWDYMDKTKEILTEYDVSAIQELYPLAAKTVPDRK
ncbi:MAG: matrixin family metalloprotease [Bdellovibrionia bacterium]